MRLYLKLSVIVALTVATQWTLKHTSVDAAYWWFAARCQVAYMTRDDAMKEGLVREAQQFTVYDCGAEYVAANTGGPSD